MAFEGFDAAMPLEAGNLLAAAPVSPAPEPTLDAALRQQGEAADSAGGGAVLRPLTADEMSLIVGGSYSDMNGDGGGGGGGGSDVVVIGPGGWDWNFGDSGGGENYPSGTGSPGSSDSPPYPAAEHTQDCGSPDGAAVQIAKHVMGTPPSGVGPNNPLLSASGKDWREVEFSAGIVRNSDGTYGALRDTIYTRDLPGTSSVPEFSDPNGQGIWHNHPTRTDPQQRLIDRYPSPSDWEGLANFSERIAPGDASFDPSLWITGPDGVTREFKLSEAALFKNMDAAAMIQGQGLAGKERTQSCD